VVERDRQYIEQAVTRAKQKNPALSGTLFDFLRRILLLQFPQDFSEADKGEWLDLVMRFQQVTGPVMAKGLEDTVFYIYNRLASLNEVGGNPERFGIALDTFHGQNVERSKSSPLGLITTSTHDTKRSEDVRARLNVLSEIPGEWGKCLRRWSQINRRKKGLVEGRWVPDRNEEYLIYQTLLGIWPLYPAEVAEESFKKRFKDFLLKAMREAKVNTSWISPNEPYEDALLKFVDALLSHGPFLEDFEVLARKVAYFGMLNSLSQTLLKITSPGTPDFFQGTEIWDFSLVDPDNRRPVDFSLRQEMLKKLKARLAQHEEDPARLARELIREWPEGSIKLFVTFRGLNYRRENLQLFQEGAYTPLVSEGNRKEQVCAFTRHTEKKAAVIIVPRFLTRISQDPEEISSGREIWKDSWIVLPGEMAGAKFFNIFTGEPVQEDEREGKKVLPLDGVLANFPIALLEGKNGGDSEASL
jgi:(1->4)-alpha-D-glucan 1-alpha-D-glucosylmutase